MSTGSLEAAVPRDLCHWKVANLLSWLLKLQPSAANASKTTLSPRGAQQMPQSPAATFGRRLHIPIVYHPEVNILGHHD